MKDDYMRVHINEPQAVKTKGVKTALFLSLISVIILAVWRLL